MFKLISFNLANKKYMSPDKSYNDQSSLFYFECEDKKIERKNI